MLVFRNSGFLDIRAIKTFGISVKSESAIGFFGTGLKYAIAILLRNNCQITIFSGGNEYEFSTAAHTVKGKEFDIVTMNGEELGFTTETGKTWEMWQALREIVCNCKDEGGTHAKVPDSPVILHDPAETTVVIKGAKAEEVYDDLDSFILQDRPDHENAFIKILNKRNNAIFYKGVKVWDKPGATFVTYDIKKKIDLTEDRTAKYDFQIKQEISAGVVLLEDQDLLEQIICAPDGYFEQNLDYGHYLESNRVKPSSQFLEICDYLIRNRSRTANKKALEYANKFLQIDTEPHEVGLTPVQKKMLDKAVISLKNARYPVDNFPILCVQSLGVNICGQARNGKIYLSEFAFTKGTKELAATLLEEYFHLTTNFEDETRELQNMLFDQLITKIEELQGEPF